MNESSLASVGTQVLREAAQTVRWHRAAVRVAKTPRMPLSLALDIVRTARHEGINTDDDAVFLQLLKR